MRLVTPDYPFRGPALFEAGSLRYENQQQGTLDSFYCIESIYENHLDDENKSFVNLI
jgi:hypothetical protein